MGKARSNGRFSVLFNARRRAFFYVLAVMATITAIIITGCTEGSVTPLPDPPKYILSFNANGGVGTPPRSQSVHGGDIATLPGNTTGMSMDSAILGGWHTNPANTGTFYDIGSEFTMPNRDVVLYAAWAVNKETIVEPGVGIKPGTGDDPEPGDEPIPVESVNKFEAVQYVGNGTINDKIKYSYSYDGLDLYYIYLGQLKNIPIYYQDAIGFNTAEMTYQFSTAAASTSTIRSTVSKNSIATISVVDQYTNSITKGVKLSQELNAKFSKKDVFDIGGKVAAEESWSSYISNSHQQTTTSSFSLTNTVEHVSTFTEEKRESFTWPLSRANGDKLGWYRYTLFTAADIYLYVIKDPTGVIFFEFREYVTPNVFGWMFDYSETMDFEKNNATYFEFDVSMLDNLPKTDTSFTTTPFAPNNVSASALSASRISVSWDPVYGADSYEIHRSTSLNGVYSLAGASDATDYVDTGLSDSTTYYYQVRAVNTDGAGPFSMYCDATTTKRGIKKMLHEFSAAGDTAYTFDISFPATIEVYAAGAGGGGQGGHKYNRWWVTDKDFAGTGGTGGGGAAVYAMFSVEEPVDFEITVGKGGSGGSGTTTNADAFTTSWWSGGAGNNGESTSVRVGSATIAAAGGSGGGGSGSVVSGGSGGRAGSMPSGMEAWATANGGNGVDGSKDTDKRATSQGGNAAKMEDKGSELSFGGGIGAKNGVAAGSGGGGSGGYNNGQYGSNGGDGKVVIVITYPEES